MVKMELGEIATKLRIDVIKMIANAGSGHPAGSLGMADIFAALFFQVLVFDPKNPAWSARDRFILSNGHICPLYYAAMAYAGYFAPAKLLSLRKLFSSLQGHPHNLSLPGVETSSGPLGQGLSQAVGIALAARLQKANWHVWTIMSDAEQQEGQTWEAVMFAGHNNLSNLIGIIDFNNIQVSGKTSEIMSVEPLVEKYQSFNWQTIEVDGHNFDEFIDACYKAKSNQNGPTAIIASTIPGKGVSFMEGKFQWHGRAPTKDEARRALKELEN